MSSASSKTESASGTMRAPCATYSSSGITLPSPAPFWMITSCPCSTNSRTPAGVMATRYSSVLISVGTPTFIGSGPPYRLTASSDEFPAPQREPELDPVTGPAQVAARQLLHPAEPVAEG